MIHANTLITRAAAGEISMTGSLSGRLVAVGRCFDGREPASLVSSCGRTKSGSPEQDLRILRMEDVWPPARQYGRFVSRRNWAFDITLAVAVGVLGQLEAWWGIGSTHRQGPLWAQSLLYAMTALLLLGRRVWPLGCLAAIVAVSLVEFVAVGSPEGTALVLPPLIATYTVGNRLEWRRSWVALVLNVVLWVSWSVLDPLTNG